MDIEIFLGDRTLVEVAPTEIEAGDAIFVFVEYSGGYLKYHVKLPLRVVENVVDLWDLAYFVDILRVSLKREIHKQDVYLHF